MRKFILSIAFFALASAAHAAPVYSTTTIVPYDPTAPSSNFSSPTLGSNSTAYTVRTGADATNFYVDVTANPVAGVNDVSGLQFANIYVGGSTFSGLVFQVTSDQVFTYGGSGPYPLLGTVNTGYSHSASTNDISFSIPFAFFESNELNIPGFTASSPGDIIRISGSQSYGYTYVGGYPNPYRLGGQTIPNAVPEPGSFALGGLGLLGLGVVAYRRRQVAA